MAQITTGIRAVLSHPAVYDLSQTIMGASAFRAHLAADFIGALSGIRVLDIGCGTAEILEFLPDVNYVGYDISEAYITKASARYGARGSFHCGLLTKDKLAGEPPFDVVLLLGVLHHMDDEVAKTTLRLAHQALRQGGRLVSFDPCYADGQNMIARFLVSKDRGQNVRLQAQYEALAQKHFSKVSSVVEHTQWIPYTRCIMECTK